MSELSNGIKDPRPLLSSAERHHQIVELNASQQGHATDKAIHQLFEAQVQNSPHAVAVAYAEQQLSYDELNKQANQLAHYLRSIGVTAESLVGICTDRSIDMVVGLLAILKTGAAYLPLDPSYPKPRLAFMIADSHLQVLITHSFLVSDLPPHQAHLLCIDCEAGLWADASGDNLDLTVDAESLAYVIYTSGSTGTPKGVQVAHQAVVNLLTSMSQQPGMTDRDVLLAVTPLSFDIAALEIYLPLIIGAKLVIASREQSTDAAELKRALESSGATLMQATPASWRMLVESGWRGKSDLKVLCGGETLSRQLAEEVKKRAAEVWNMYGPTETTIWSTCVKVESGEGEVSIGRPIANTQVYVLDESMRVVPGGVAGEVYIGGEGVARGYWRRADLTAERFIANPYSEAGGGRLYRTGDIGRSKANGEVEYLGRSDQQVKVHGHRIELGEIEAALLEHEGIAEAVVVGREERDGNKQLVGYVVVREEEDLTGVEVRSYLKAKVPGYMVPAQMVMMDAMPLTANGKVDRKALPAPDEIVAARTQSAGPKTRRNELGELSNRIKNLPPDKLKLLEMVLGEEFSESIPLEDEPSAPRNPVETILAAIWMEVLGVDEIDIHDSFFDSGGHSLLVGQILNRVGKAFHVEISLRQLFDSPTIAGLAGIIEQVRREGLQVPRLPIEPAPRDAQLPLSYAQQRLWFLNQLDPGSTVYNIPGALRLKGDLNITALERSLAEICRRHEVLRTCFTTVDGEPRQVIHSAERIRMAQVDLDELEGDQKELVVRTIAAAQARLQFDLTQIPLIRLNLVRLSEQDFVLIIIMHHIISDGWSTGIFFNELTKLYQAYSTGAESPLEELNLQYADYSLWQHDPLQVEVFDKQLQYWKQQLAGAPAILEMPTDRVRPAMQSHRGACHTFILSRQTSAELKALSRQQATTLYMTLLAVYQTLLYRYSGESDINVGTVIANRNRAETEGLIGFFVNTLVMRGDLSGEPTFLELLARVRETALAAYAHQDLPFEQVVEALQPERSMSHSPLFQVAFVVQNTPMKRMEMEGIELTPFTVQTGTAKYELLLTMVESGEQIVGVIEYNTELYERGTIERLSRHYEKLAESAVGGGEGARISELEMISGKEKEEILRGWNGKEKKYEKEESIQERFEREAARRSEAIAVEYEGEGVSYGEMNRRANQLGNYLRKQGVGPEAVVGICLERSLEMIVAVLGVLKAGGAYLPLEPHQPDERLEYMLADSQARWLVTGRGQGERIAQANCQRVRMDEQEEEISRQSEEAVESGVSGGNAAYIIYTSGSTGKPKGVVVCHEQVVRLFEATEEWYGFNQEDVWTMFHSYGFDFSVWEMWGALRYGGKLVVVPYEVSRTVEAFYELVEKAGVTVLNQTPSAFRVFMKEDERRRGDLKLRQVIFGGEALEYGSLREWMERRGEDKPELVNMYGITETTVHVTYHRVRREEVVNGIGSVIGARIRDLKVYVLDEGMGVVPVGVAGELYVGGDGLARGYLNRPELTAERFVPNPFSEIGGERLYRTGDVCRYGRKGQIEYVGRKDEQVKVRGYRIELGEIEAVLGEQAGVSECVVVTKAEEGGFKRLVAYVVAEEGEQVSASEMRSGLKAKLPEYMVPASFVMIDRLPLTANGKVDRRALPEPEGVNRESEYEAPRTLTEEIVAGIWGDLLGVETISRDDNFFDIGGHSLLATQVISRLRDSFHIEVALRRLFETPTVAGLAATIEEHRRAGQSLALPPIERVARNQPLPVSYAQQRLWLIDQLTHGSAAYNITLAIRLKGELAVKALRRSFTEIVRRHEVLRTSFEMHDTEPVQVIATEKGFGLAILDLQEVEGKQSVARQVASQEAARRFDLRESPLMRASLMKVGEEEHVLVVVMHHIITDGWSNGLFIKELCTFYEAFNSGSAPELEPLSIQYVDYAVWQRQWLQGEVLEAQLAYWKQHLDGAPEILEMPTDRVRPAVQSTKGGYETLVLSQELSGKLRRMSQREGATLYMVMLAGFEVLLYRHSHQRDFCIGTGVANRRRTEVEQLMGVFVNTLVMRSRLEGEPTFKELIRRVREETIEAHAHQDLPFEHLVEALELERSLSHNPIFQVMFTLQNAPKGLLEMGGLELSGFEVEGKTAKFDLILSLSDTGRELIGTLEYNADLYEEETVRRLLKRYARVMEEVVRDDEQKIGELKMISEEERRQLVDEWNRTEVEYEKGCCIHQLFEQWAEKTPTALAVTDGTRQLTYDELNRQANRLAHYLSDQGIGPETPVGICVKRSIEMVVGLLGILKAGGAYAPLDPTYPKERLDFMLEDSQAKILLTQESMKDIFAGQKTRVFCLDSDWSLLSPDSENPAPLTYPTNLAYVIYTSGSTGQPKGVQIQHRSLGNLVSWHQSVFSLTAEDRASQVAGPAFDASVWELWPYLTAGASIHLPDEETHASPLKLMNWMADNQITISFLPTPMAEVMLEQQWPQPVAMRTLLTGGDKLHAGRLQRPAFRLVNNYGPTENTVVTTWADVNIEEHSEREPTIGRPIHNAQVYILDETLAPVPVGINGEIYISGEGLARGYLRRPDLTADKFIPNPFSVKGGERLYKSGDVARYLSDGNIEFVGRVDQQVKVRGFRIELEEIETVLKELDGVKQTVVVAREDEARNKTLVAYVVSEKEESPTFSQMRNHLKEKLPEYMVPVTYVTLDAMPVSANGKLDRRALPAPEEMQPKGESVYEAPRTPIEEILAGIWCEVLDIEKVGIHENFFAIGGHSLLATLVMSRVVESFRLDLGVKSLFHAPTVSELATVIEEATRKNEGLEVPPIEIVSREEKIPLSYAQQRLWFVDHLATGSSLFIIPAAMRLTGKLNIEALGSSLNEIVRRHEVLRTRFEVVDGVAVQVIEPDFRLVLPLVDLHDLNINERESMMRGLAKKESQTRFDLSRGPLLRVTLLRLEAEEHVLFLTMHHIITDGWSGGLFVKELCTFYEAYSSGSDPQVEELPIQYADYAVWQRNWLQGEVLARQLAFWKQQLAGAPTLLELPTDHVRPAVQGFNGGRHGFVVEASISRQLNQMNREQGVTLFMSLMAAYQILLHRLSGEEEIVVATPIANRNRAEVEELIGCFVNMLVLRTRVEGGASYEEVLKEVREAALGAYGHQEFPFEQLVEALQPERSMSHAPLAQVSLTLHNVPRSALRMSGVRVSGVEIESGAVEYDLSLIMAGEGERLAGLMIYNRDLFEEETIKRFADAFQRVLKEVVSEPGKKVREIELMSEAEKVQAIVEWNQTEREYPRESTIQEQFERQAARRPEAIAVVCEQERMSYGELNRRANQLAHYLRKLGVGEEVAVGICLERSIEMVVGLLGILKAGGVYVPLERSYPVERLNYMIDDGQIGVIVSREEEAESLPAGVSQLVLMDSDQEVIASEPESNLEIEVSGGNLAYIIYTSGSTGQPKGVCITHRAVNRLVINSDYVKLDEEEVIGQASTVSFDAATFEIWGALLNGARLEIISKGVALSPVEYARKIEQAGISVLFITTALFNEIAREQPQAYQKVSTVLFGGESVDVESVKEVLEKGRPKRLLHVYGPTESTTFATSGEVEEVKQGARTVAIGRPISNTTAYVLDERMEVVRVGVAGELYLGGEALARGYLRRAEVTAERFVPNPFSKAGGKRLYRTGDVCRYDRDGHIEYVGRRDEQVKVRGYRIELGEIEAALGEQAGVRECVVIAKAEESGAGKRLVAYVVVEEEQAVTIARLRNGLKAKLPEYMVPASFVMLEELPLNANGKVERRALLSIEEQVSQQAQSEYVAPRNQTERHLAEVWQEVLSIEKVGIKDSYFELGGDSIRSIQVIAKARQRGIVLTIQDLFQHPTIEELSEVARRAEGDESSQKVAAFALLKEEDRKRISAGVEDAYPLSKLQAGMLFHSELDPETAVYHDVISFHLESPLDIAAFRKSLDELIQRHPLLRTSFDLSSYSEPLQFVHRRVELPLEVEQISRQEAAEQQRIVGQWISEESRRGFEWQQAPLLRVKLHIRSEKSFQLSLSFHHAILDGWSLASLQTELLRQYWHELGEVGGGVAEAPRSSYREFVAMEKEALANEESEKFWEEKLRGSEVVKLPRLRRAAAGSDHRRLRKEAIEVRSEVLEGLKDVARRADVPLKSVLLAAHLKVMQVVSNQKEIVTGMMMNGRSEQEDGERVLGLFLNSVPVKVEMRGGSWIELAKAAFAEECELLPHRRYPLAEMQRKQGGLIFETLFGYLNFHVQEGTREIDGMKVVGYADVTETEFPLLAAFQVDPSVRRMLLSLVMDEEVMEEAQMEAIKGYYVRTLEAMARRSEGRYEQESVLSEEEKRQAIREWNKTYREYESRRSIQERFEEEVERTPEALSVECGEERISYWELNRRANQLAHYLRSIGVNRESMIGICTERSIEMVIGLLAILKSGAAYVPLDPSYPKQRLAFMIADSHLQVLITHSFLVSDLPLHQARLLCIDSDACLWAESPGDNLDLDIASETLAYVIYTSGSTGQPKGVQVAHQSVVNLLTSMGNQPGMTAKDVLLAVTPLSFDIAALEIFLPLMLGARLVITARDVAADAETLMTTIESSRATLMQATPATWRMLVESGWGGKRDLKALCGGEALSRSLAEELKERVSELWNMYGPTETTVWSTCVQVESTTEEISIGRPIANTQVYVLDENMQVVPVGVAGEVYIGGQGLARGYWRSADLTAERFIADPYSREAGGRLYRTGDSGRRKADGEVEYLGRADNQVKVRGHRIEIGEIEAVLMKEEGIAEAVVVGRDDRDGSKKLVGYVVARHQVKLTGAGVRNRLKQKLPPYMVPAHIVMMEAMPLTANGKVDRKALPVPEEITSQTRTPYQPPRTPTEEIVAGVWSSVLGIEKVGSDDNFFDLGGHSLLATQVISRIRDSFNTEMALRQLFESPTVASLAAAVDSRRLQRQALPIPPIKPVSRHQPLPVSYAQQRLWFLDQLTQGSAAYNVTAAIRLSGNLDVAALVRSFQQIIRRHEVLRTSFEMAESEPVQVIAEELEFRLAMIDLQEVSDQQAAAREVVGREASRRFELRRSPLMRASLMKQGEGEHVLVVVMHHIITDAWSVGVLIKELSQLYGENVRGEACGLEELAIQYADYAVWQREWLRGEEMERQIGYWKEKLAGVPEMLEMGTDRVRPAVQSTRGGNETLVLSEELSGKLRRMSQRMGATMYMVMLAGFEVLLYRQSHQRDFCIGTGIANRRQTEVEKLIGMFVNTLVMRSRLEGEPTFKELVRRVREEIIEAHEHQDLPFEQLVEALGLERSLSHNPIFQVMFILQNAPKGVLELEGLKLSMFEVEGKTARFDLVLSVSDSGRELIGTMEYNTDLYEGETVRRLLKRYERVMDEVVKDEDKRIGAIEMMSEEERRQLLEEWNRTELEYEKGCCIHQLFEQQVEKTPGAVALRFGSEEIRYGKLNERANQLAHYLISKGIAQEGLVAILLNRSIEMVVSLLGILKAGAAYVALDATNPAQRLEYMLEDSGARLIVTEERFQHLVPQATEAVIIDLQADEIAAHRKDNAAATVTPDNLAYIIYTSGSTGKPKGVMGEHRGVINRLEWMWRKYPFAEGDVCSQKTRLSFVDAVWEVFGGLLQGVVTEIIGDEVVRDSRALVEALSQAEVTRVVVVPGQLKAMLESSEEIAEKLKKVKMVVVSGEELRAEVVRKYEEEMGGKRLLNLYGSTEVSADATWYEVDGKDLESGRIGIGRAIANLHVYVLDERMKVVPVGVPGELYVGGEGLARGYLNRPELTAERFVPNPYSPAAGQRLYQTGDLCRFRRDGQIEYIGRSDEQVKVRGHRIELGEIEAALKEQVGVRECVVVAREEEAARKRLVAYVVVDDEQAASVADLRSYLKARLPEYMVPASYVFIERLPLTASGKLDRRLLPAPKEAHQQGEYVAPRTSLEMLVADIWAEVLHVKRIGINENFFEIGGNSLNAVKVVARIHKECGALIQLRDMFIAPTIAELSATIQATAGEHYSPISALEERDCYDLSPAQKALWIACQSEDHSIAYNVTRAYGVQGHIDKDAFRRAVASLVERHEVLRTTFVLVDGEPRQRIHKADRFGMIFLDLTARADGEAITADLIEKESLRYFDLETALLFRVYLVKLSAMRYVFLFSLPHIICDGWSISILMKEMIAAYRAYERDQDNPLPALRVQAKDCAAWQIEQLNGQAMAAHREYWLQKLGGTLPGLNLPTDYSRRPERTFNGAQVNFSISPELSAGLYALTKDHGATLFMTLVSAYKALLLRYTGQEDLVIGSPISGRAHLDLENQIGLYLNMLALRTKAGAEDSYSDLLENVKRTVLEAYEHQSYPFDRLVSELAPERDASRPTLIATGLTLHNQWTPQQGSQADLQIAPWQQQTMTSQYDLWYFFVEADNRILASVVYNTDLFTRHSIELMASRFVALLQQAVNDPDLKIMDFDFSLEPVNQPDENDVFVSLNL